MFLLFVLLSMKPLYIIIKVQVELDKKYDESIIYGTSNLFDTLSTLSLSSPIFTLQTLLNNLFPLLLPLFINIYTYLYCNMMCHYL